MRLNPLLTLGLMALAAGASAQQAKVNDAPLTEKWAPTEWGADDHTRHPGSAAFGAE